MPSPALGPGWDSQRLHAGVPFGDVLLHVVACARDGARGPWSSHFVRTQEREVAGLRRAPLPSWPAGDIRGVMGFVSGPRPEELGPEYRPLLAAGPPQDRGAFDPTHDLANLIAHAESAGIAVTWSDLDVIIGGFVYRPRRRTARRRDPRAAPADLDARRLPRVVVGDVVVVLNPTQTWAATLEVMLHELAHALLGHVGPAPSVRQGPGLMAARSRPPWAAREFEADLSSYVAAQRRGSPARRLGLGWMLRFADLERDGEIATVDLIQVFRVAETLAAWCAVRPDTVGVRAASAPPSGPPARTLEPDPDYDDAETPVPVRVRATK